MNRKQQSVIEYLLEENRVMKQQLNGSGKKLRLSNVQRRSLAKKAMATMCVADFLTTEVWTLHGLVRYHTLFVMNLAKRKVQIAQISCQMNGQVMAQVPYAGKTKGRNGSVVKFERRMVPRAGN